MSDTVAERYARAIFEVGEEAGKLAVVAQHFESFAQTYESSHELRVALNDPVLDDATRTRVLQAMASRLGLCREAQNAVLVMMKRRRLAELGPTARRLVQLSDEKAGVLRAEVTSPGPLAESYAEELRRELEKVTGRRVVLERNTDPALIAGVVLRIGSHVVDGSLKGRLDEFERRLARAS
jgi:F-type H+-transporting ATPase subunit delta